MARKNSIKHWIKKPKSRKNKEDIWYENVKKKLTRNYFEGNNKFDKTSKALHKWLAVKSE